MCLSVPQTAVAATRIRISSGPGFGLGQSRTSVPAAPSAGALLTTAFIEQALGYQDLLLEGQQRAGGADAITASSARCACGAACVGRRGTARPPSAHRRAA